MTDDDVFARVVRVPWVGRWDLPRLLTGVIDEYGAARQLLMAGLSDPTELLRAMETWQDHVKRLHATIATRAYEFITANCAYVEAQQQAMDLSVAASTARIHLHNAIVECERALEAAQTTNAVDPVDPSLLHDSHKDQT